MVRYRRAYIDNPEALYFLTYVTMDREHLFLHHDDLLMQLSVWEEINRKYGAELFAYVFLSNHSHIILKQGNAPFSKIMHLFKRRMNYGFQRSPASPMPGSDIKKPSQPGSCIPVSLQPGLSNIQFSDGKRTLFSRMGDQY
ncbi:hypothetical protein K9N50_05820 [bacterium]|nr:hypothetical protein [bacterium]